MNKFKKLLAVLVCAAMALAVVPEMTVNAETSVIQSKIDTLFSLLGNNYFNVSRDGSCGKGLYGHGCNNCSTSYIIKAPWFVELFGNITLEQMPRYYVNESRETCSQNAMSCMGFAVFAEWYIFKSTNSDVITTNYVGTYDYNLENMNAHVKIGDVLRLVSPNSKHSAIFIRADENGAYVMDSNYNVGYEKGNCVVYEHYIEYGVYDRCTVSRASNYNEVQPDDPSSGGEIEPDDPPTEDEDIVPDGLEYDLYDDHVEITDYTGDATELKVPSKIEGLPVTTIGNSAFSGCTGLATVNIGNSITEIAEYAFYKCTSLTSVDIRNGVTEIGSSPFEGCYHIKNMNIGSGIIEIDTNLFDGCHGLTNVTIPDSVKRIDDEAFKDTKLYLDKTNWENDVLYINNHLIKASEEISGDYTIKPGTRTIADRAFYGCRGLTNVTIPDSVTYIGEYAFNDTALYNNSANWDKIMWNNKAALYINNNLIEIQYDISGDYTIRPDTRVIAGGAFRSSRGLTTVNIPDSVTTIGAGAFWTCDDLTSVDVPNSVTYIGAEAFYGCTGLTNVNIPDSVTKIVDSTFRGCTNLPIINIPGSVTKIGNSAFYGCTNLSRVKIPDVMIP